MGVTRLGDIRVTLDDKAGDTIRVAQTRFDGKCQRSYCVTMTIDEAEQAAKQILRRVEFAKAAAARGLT